MNEKKRVKGCMMLVAACFSGACGWTITPSEETTIATNEARGEEAPGTCLADFEFRRQMRLLWEGRVSLNRMYIVSVLADLPDAKYVATRLTKNHVDIGAAIKPYYGEAIGDELARVLYDYEEASGAYLLSVHAKEEDQTKHWYMTWRRHATQVASYLAAVNPRWNGAEWESEMHKEVELRRREMSARLAEDWSGDLVAYDLAIKQALRMSDLLSVGIAEQFPRHTE